MRTVSAENILFNPEPYGVSIFGRIQQDCACLASLNHNITVTVLHVETGHHYSAQAYVGDDPPDSGGYRHWSTLLSLPNSLNICNSNLTVSCQASDNDGSCESQTSKTFHINCCPYVENITCLPELQCSDNGATRRIQVSLDIVRENFGGNLYARATFKRAGDSIAYSRDTQPFSEQTLNRKHCEVHIPVPAPLSGSSYAYDLTVELFPERPSVCEKKQWSLSDPISILVCDCPPFVGDFQLVDPAQNTPLTEEIDSNGRKCFSLTRIKVIAPASPEGDVDIAWDDNPNITPVPDQRAVIVDLSGVDEVVVAATLGNRCRTPLTKIIRRCTGNGNGNGNTDPDPHEFPTPVLAIPWCWILFLVGLSCLLIGALLLGIGFCGAQHATWIVATLAAITGGTASAIGVAVAAALIVCVVVGITLMFIGSVLIILCLLLCTACGKHSKERCAFLSAIKLILTTVATFWALLAFVLTAVVGVFCGLGFAIGFVDFGLLLLIAKLIGYSTGCEEWPTGWPEQLRFGPPKWLRVDCG